jgi:hypothetical protein
VTWLRAGDGDELLAHLHPLVVQEYGEDVCESYLANFAIEDFEANVLDVGNSDAWTWEATDGSHVVADAIAVDLEVTQSGQTSTIVSHVVVDGGQVQWFTRCDGTA